MLTPLRYHRMLRDWKSAEAAKRIRVSASYYSRIESGKLRPPARLRRRIAGLFGLTQKVLFEEPPKRRYRVGI